MTSIQIAGIRIGYHPVFGLAIEGNGFKQACSTGTECVNALRSVPNQQLVRWLQGVTRHWRLAQSWSWLDARIL